jgi:hypothetical protein
MTQISGPATARVSSRSAGCPAVLAEGTVAEGTAAEGAVAEGVLAEGVLEEGAVVAVTVGPA